MPALPRASISSVLSVSRQALLHLFPHGCRGKGVGSELVRSLLRLKAAPGDRVVLLTLQGTAPFYQRLGFSPVTDPAQARGGAVAGLMRDNAVPGCADSIAVVFLCFPVS